MQQNHKWLGFATNYEKWGIAEWYSTVLQSVPKVLQCTYAYYLDLFLNFQQQEINLSSNLMRYFKPFFQHCKGLDSRGS